MRQKNSKNSTPKQADRRDLEKLYNIVLSEERRLRLWLSHLATSYPDTPYSEIAIKALAGATPPPHPLPVVEPAQNE